MVQNLHARGLLPKPTVAGTPLRPVGNDPLSNVMPAGSTDLELREMFRQFLAVHATQTPPVPPMSMGLSAPTLPAPTVTKSPALRSPDPPHYEGDPALLEGWQTTPAVY